MRVIVWTLFAVTLAVAPIALADEATGGVDSASDLTCGVASEGGNLVMVVTDSTSQPDCSTYVSDDFPIVLDEETIQAAGRLETLCVVSSTTSEFTLLWSGAGLSPAAEPAARGFAIQVFCTRARNFAADHGWEYQSVAAGA